MGYSLSIVTPPVSRDDTDAWKQLDDLCNETLGNWPYTPLNRTPTPAPPPEFRQLYDLLIERFPCLSSLPNGQEDETIWSDGPLWNNFGTRVAVLGIRRQRADEALPFIVESANSLGLIVFEPTFGVIFRWGSMSSKIAVSLPTFVRKNVKISDRKHNRKFDR